MICLYFYEYSALDQSDAAFDAMTTGAWLGLESPFTSHDGAALSEVWQPSTGRYAFYNVGEKRLLSDTEYAATRLECLGCNADTTSLYLQAA